MQHCHGGANGFILYPVMQLSRLEVSLGNICSCIPCRAPVSPIWLLGAAPTKLPHVRLLGPGWGLDEVEASSAIPNHSWAWTASLPTLQSTLSLPLFYDSHTPIVLTCLCSHWVGCSTCRMPLAPHTCVVSKSTLLCFVTPSTAATSACTAQQIGFRSQSCCLQWMMHHELLQNAKQIW